MAKKKADDAGKSGAKVEAPVTEKPAAPSKMGMVREALGKLGAAAKPAAIGEYVKTKYGIELPPQIISSYKSVINSKPNGGYGIGGRAAGGNVSIGDVEAIKGLIGRVGERELSQLVQVLSK